MDQPQHLEDAGIIISVSTTWEIKTKHSYNHCY